MVTGLFSEAGYFMGEDLYPSRDSNPKGFFESPQINGINGELIASLPPEARFDETLREGQHWLARVSLDAPFHLTEDLERRIREAIAKQPFCFKDPRFSYTLPVWRPYLANTAYICVFRDPGTTARSIVTECESMTYLRDVVMDRSRALDIWKTMYQHVLERHCNEGDWFFIHYDQCFDQNVLNKMEQFTGAKLEKSFPESQFKRSIPDVAMPGDIEDLYEELCGKAGYVYNSRNYYHMVIDEKEAQVRQLEKAYHHEIRSLIAEHESVTAEYEEVKERTGLMERALTELQAQNDDLQLRLAIARTQASDLQYLVNSIYSSRSWRIAAPYRFLAHVGRVNAQRISLLAKTLTPSGVEERIRIADAIVKRLPIPSDRKSKMRAELAAKRPVRAKEPYAASGDWMNSNGVVEKVLPQADSKWVLMADHRLPMPENNSGSLRLFHIMKILLDKGYRVFFISNHYRDDYKWVFADESDLQPYEDRLKELGVEYVFGREDAVEHLKNYGYRYNYAFLFYPDVAFHFAPAVRAYCPQARLIFDPVDLHYVRLRRESTIKDDPRLLIKAERYRKIETLLIKNSDCVLAISESERDIIKSIEPDMHVELVQNIHEFAGTKTPFSERKDLLFIGHYLHTPNVDAVKYLVHDIFPLIRAQLPDVQINLVGSNPTDEILSINMPGVNVVGFVEDLTSVFEENRVFVAPLRYGAGVKGKIGQAMSYGLPLVTTDIGAEGMQLVHEDTAMIANDATAFANSVVRLYTDQELWERIAANSVEHIRKQMSIEKAASTLEKVLTNN